MIGGTGYEIHFNPCLGDAMVRTIVIERNQIEVARGGIGVAMSGPLGPGYQYDFTIRRNTFTGVGNPIVAAYVGGLIVEDNEAEAGTVSYLNWPEYPSFGIVSKRNRLLGTPIGLEDSR